jgi:hypothetical protein
MLQRTKMAKVLMGPVRKIFVPFYPIAVLNFPVNFNAGLN